MQEPPSRRLFSCPASGTLPLRLGEALVEEGRRGFLAFWLRFRELGQKRVLCMGFDMRVSASGPISRVLSGTAIYLERESPRASSTQPERTAGHRMALLFALAPDGVYQAATLPPRWCALTAPFQLFSCVAHAACRCMFRAGEFSFLWHCPSGRPAQPLAGILPCGARTFLAPRRVRDRLARSPVVL